jgi:hypothetical protein
MKVDFKYLNMHFKFTYLDSYTQPNGATKDVYKVIRRNPKSKYVWLQKNNEAQAHKYELNGEDDYEFVVLEDGSKLKAINHSSDYYDARECEVYCTDSEVKAIDRPYQAIAHVHYSDWDRNGIAQTRNVFYHIDGNHWYREENFVEF